MSVPLKEDRGPAPDRTEVAERIAASLEAIARELALIRAHLDGTEGDATPAAGSGPWLRRRRLR